MSTHDIRSTHDKNTHDTNGRPWAKLSQLQAGDRVEVDGGFDECFEAGSVHTLNDKLAIKGNCGAYHRLQADDGEHCIGIYKVD
jgi:hypothetical protein